MADNKTVFPDIYTDIEEVKDTNGQIIATVIYNVKGDYSVIFSIQNTVQQYCADKDQYSSFVSLYENIIQMLGEGYAIQKQDIFVREQFSKEGFEDMQGFMYDAYFRHFTGRAYNRHVAYLTITMQCKQSVLAPFDAKKWEDFLTKVNKMQDIFRERKIKASLLDKREISEYIHRFAALSFNKGTFAMTNFKASEEELKMGSRGVKNIQLVDIDEVNIPTVVRPFTEKDINGTMLTTDFMAFLMDIPYTDCVVYNQVVIIPQQRKEILRLTSKSKNHGSLPDPSNKIAKQDIDAVLDLLAKESKLLVYTNFNLIAVAERGKNMTQATSFIETKLFDIGVMPSKKAYNQLELYTASFPGNAFTFNPKYDRFLTLHDAALCFFFKEYQKTTEESPLKIFYTDRKGLPVGIDITGKEGEEKMTDNANFFCLGPSGSGKSFHMNSVVEQLFLQDTDVIIIDTGNSYEGIAGSNHWRYITYTKEKPISMNPFKITKQEYEDGYTEKKDFLISLLTLIWLGSDAQLTNIQSTMFEMIIDEYYVAYFNPFEGFSSDQRDSIKHQLMLESKQNGSFEEYRKHIMEVYGIKDTTIEEILAEEEQQQQQQVTELTEEMAYTIDAQKTRIKDKIEKLQNLAERGIDGEAQAAANILEKHEQQLRQIEHPENMLMRITPAVIEKGYSRELDKVVNQMEKQKRELKVTSLSFNSFYEFAIQRIPQVAKEKGISFTVEEFKFVLQKFYKGGTFETTLNNDVDVSLFEEKGIVFEVDNIKDNKLLFPIVTLIIMDTFIQKMRLKKGRKVMVIEEAWKAIASPTMADYIKYLYKTVRKFNGIVGVVTQELQDIISSPIVREAIINNSDIKILLDQNKFKERYDQIAEIMGITKTQRAKIFTINNMDNKENRPYFKEVYVQRGQQSDVFGVEVPPEWYMAFTTERIEKEALKVYIKHYDDNTEKAIEAFVRDMEKLGFRNYKQFARKVNEQNKPADLWNN